MLSQFDVYLNMQMVGLFISPVFYGAVVALSTGNLRLLARKRFKDFKKLRIYLVLIDLFMWGCSTAALVQDLVWMKRCERERFLAVTVFGESPVSQAELISRVRSGTIPLVLAVWGATCFMVWRCVVLGQRIKSRRSREGLNGILYLLLVLILVSGIFHFFSTFQIGSMPSAAILSIITPSVGFILSLIVVLHAVMLRNKEPESKRPDVRRRYSFSSMAMVAVESGAVVVVASTFYPILYFDGHIIGYEVIPRILLPHICAISTLVIAHRVAKGNDLTTNFLSSYPSQAVRAARTLTVRVNA